MTAREWCEEDDGPRECCDTAQLGPHRDDCPASPAKQDAMRDHELMYRHRTEVPPKVPDAAGFARGARMILDLDPRSMWGEGEQ
jgi:hypothetical protein